MDKYAQDVATSTACPDHLSVPAQVLVPRISLPPQLKKMIESGTCQFKAGLRIGSLACKGGQGKTFHLTKVGRVGAQEETLLPD